MAEGRCFYHKNNFNLVMSAFIGYKAIVFFVSF